MVTKKCFSILGIVSIFVTMFVCGMAFAAFGGTPTSTMFAPIGAYISKYMNVPETAKAPAPLAHNKAYRLQDLGNGLYMVTNNAWSSMFLVYDKGVVLIDAPPSYSEHIPEAIREITNNSVTHIIYSHAHADHIGGVKMFVNANTKIIAHQETKMTLLRAQDPNRPIPNQTFNEKYTLNVGGKILELSYFGNAHTPGNIFIYAPEQKVLMVVDIVFPGWMPWRRFALAADIPGYFKQVELIKNMNWEIYIGGHVARIGTHADVEMQYEFMMDIKKAASDALKSTVQGEAMNSEDLSNPWAVAGNYIDRVAAKCVNAVSEKWSKKLGGYDVFIWDQCYAMEQSLRID